MEQCRLHLLDSRVEPDLSDRHSVLYGHHMKNGTMFSDIADYKDQTYYENHATGMILTPSKNYWIEFLRAMLPVPMMRTLGR